MRKNGVVLGFVLAILLGACSQLPGFTPTPGTGPTADLFNTAVAQTLTARPTLVTGCHYRYGNSAPSLTIANARPCRERYSIGYIYARTASHRPDDHSCHSNRRPCYSEFAPANVTATPTLVPSQVTAIWTLAVRKYGTLPPLVPFSQVTLINKAKTEAYISLHVDLPQGGNTVIEYPVEGRIKIDAPVGFYSYVAWVGGNKMVGNFRLHHNDDLSITLYKDKVVIK